MGIELFLDDDSDKVKIPDKNYKDKVDESLKTKFDIDDNDESSKKRTYTKTSIAKLNLPNNRGTIKDRRIKKVGMSIYFKEDDLLLLKAISWNNGITVNEAINHFILPQLEKTRRNMAKSFDYKALAQEYDNNSKMKKKKKAEEE